MIHISMVFNDQQKCTFCSFNRKFCEPVFPISLSVIFLSLWIPIHGSFVEQKKQMYFGSFGDGVEKLANDL